MDTLQTKWSIIASGQGANRISFLYYANYKNPTIEDRVLLLNTTPSDIKPEEPLKYLIEKNPEYLEEYNNIKMERVCIFGKSPAGAGNDWKVGEEEAREDFDNIRRYISRLGLQGKDVVLGISTLGGGTGNGSIPFIIEKMKQGGYMGHKKINSVLALGIMPYEFEGPQRFFNSLSGISRLLKTPKGDQNADMVILVDNSQVESLIDTSLFEEEERYNLINHEIIKSIKMLIAPGGEGAKSTIDVADYYKLPSRLGTYHFTPCLSLGNDPEIFNIKSALETAVSKPFVPVDVKTATMAYIIVVAPEKYVSKGEFTQEDLESISQEWAKKNLAGTRGGLLRYCSLISSKETDKLDVMVLLGGFSLKNIVSRSIQKYYDFKDSLKGIDLEEIDALESRLKEYISTTEWNIQNTRREEVKMDDTLAHWGFRD